MNSRVVVEAIPVTQSGSNDPWKEYSFVYGTSSVLPLIYIELWDRG